MCCRSPSAVMRLPAPPRKTREDDLDYGEFNTGWAREKYGVPPG